MAKGTKTYNHNDAIYLQVCSFVTVLNTFFTAAHIFSDIIKWLNPYPLNTVLLVAFIIKMKARQCFGEKFSIRQNLIKAGVLKCVISNIRVFPPLQYEDSCLDPPHWSISLLFPVSLCLHALIICGSRSV